MESNHWPPLHFPREYYIKLQELNTTFLETVKIYTHHNPSEILLSVIEDYRIRVALLASRYTPSPSEPTASSSPSEDRRSGTLNRCSPPPASSHYRPRYRSVESREKSRRSYSKSGSRSPPPKRPSRIGSKERSRVCKEKSPINAHHSPINARNSKVEYKRRCSSPNNTTKVEKHRKSGNSSDREEKLESIEKKLDTLMKMGAILNNLQERLREQDKHIADLKKQMKEQTEIFHEKSTKKVDLA
ncbi:hypothetical protein AVEN_107110-1 [Araneus ventricosus]|uniref:Uncharacterized protein n=1 Tax=Araneus ventricosus TaxID=182803 RepID=A0A4Y2G3G3_ARAVE|nr:hypothetical protein AVEN_107110-1 [Araneus ventricosus]